MMGRDQEPTSSAAERELSINRLVKINGIAMRTAEAFYELGIHDYPDLVLYLRQHTAEEVSQALKQFGVNRYPWFINMEELIRQAETLSQKPEPSKNFAPGMPCREPGDHDAVFTVSFDRFKDEDGNLVLSITVYDEKDAGKEQTFVGMDTSRWVNWILERVNLPGTIELYTPRVIELARPVELEGLVPEAEGTEMNPHTETQAASLELPGEPYDAQVKIKSVQFAPVEVGNGSAGKMLRAEINFTLSGADARILTSYSLPYRLAIYSIDYSQGTPALAGMKDGQLEPFKYEYKQQLEIVVPAAGEYQYHCGIRLPPEGQLMDDFQFQNFTA